MSMEIKVVIWNVFFCSSEARPTSGNKSRNGGGCLRCGYEVYAAEQMISKNKVTYNFTIYFYLIN